LRTATDSSNKNKKSSRPFVTISVREDTTDFSELETEKSTSAALVRINVSGDSVTFRDGAARANGGVDIDIYKT
jgi:hypothetical protein